MSTPSLFPESPDVRALAIDHQIHEILHGYSGGRFGLRIQKDESAVLAAIRFHRGASNAISIDELEQKTGLNPRQVKQIVRVLRLAYELPIGSSKSGTDGGYFIILTPDDMRTWLSGPLMQVRAEMEVVRAVAGKQAVAELLGQLTLEVDR